LAAADTGTDSFGTSIDGCKSLVHFESCPPSETRCRDNPWPQLAQYLPPRHGQRFASCLRSDPRHYCITNKEFLRATPTVHVPGAATPAEWNWPPLTMSRRHPPFICPARI